MEKSNTLQQSKNTSTDKSEVIDLRLVALRLWSRKKLFLWVWLVTFVLSCLWIFPIPRTYTTELKLAPEMESGVSTSALGSIASSFGFDLGGMQTTDAIYPMIYPNLFESNDFIINLMSVQVVNEDGDVKTTYFDYLQNHQKKTFYSYPIRWIKKKIKEMLPDKPVPGSFSNKALNPNLLSEQQKAVVDKAKQNINCDVDLKTQLITIVVKDQDRMICAQVADSARAKLQDFITNYRTNKARNDLDYYTRLTDEARVAYEDATNKYSLYVDAHKNSILQSFITERDKLENDMQMKYNTYSAMSTQLEAAKAKVQERTPAFTLLQGASVPIKPTGPKRMIFIAAMLFLAFWGTCIYIYRKEIISQFLV